MFTMVQTDKIRFGRGSMEKLGEETKLLGDRALLITGRSAMRKAGILQRAVEKLTRAGVVVVTYEQVEHDPSLETVEGAIALARSERCDVVVAIGGGSVIDAGKATALLVAQPRPLRDYFDKKAEIAGPGLPLVAVPTTAGTGSEATVNAVLTDTKSRIKKSLRCDYMLPRVAVLDPELTLCLPHEATVNTGMDALTQAMECFVSRSANAISDALSLRAASLLYEALPVVVEDGSNLDARERMLLGSLMAGMAFCNTALGAAHGLSHPIGVYLGLSHGFICGVLLPDVFEANKQVDFVDSSGRSTPEKLAELAAHMRFETIDAMIAGLRDLRSAVGLPDSLAEYGLTEDLFPIIVAQCRSRSMRNNPFEMSDEDVRRFLSRFVRPPYGG